MTSRTDLDVRLSWIIVSHQSASDLERLLPSLVPALQGWRMAGVPCELIIVDNASSDGSVAVARQLAPDALIIENTQNVGYGPAINTAARRARGAWLVIGNADLVVPEGGLVALPEALAALPADVALAGPTLLDREGNHTLSAGFFPTLITLMQGLARRCRHRKYLPLRRHVAGEVDWVTGACLFARSGLLRQAGGFDQEFFLYYEDVDLAQRLARAGKRCMYVPSVKVVHMSPHHERPPQAQIELIVRASRKAYFAKHRPAWERLCLALLGKLEPIIRHSSAHEDALAGGLGEPRVAAGIRVSAPVNGERSAVAKPAADLAASKVRAANGTAAPRRSSADRAMALNEIATVAHGRDHIER